MLLTCFCEHPRDNIGGWAANVSQRYSEWQEGKLEISPQEEYEFNELAAVGFEFNVVREARSRRPWDESFAALLKFIEKEGHANVPLKYIADMRLGVWVKHQRAAYKKISEGKTVDMMTQERMERLENVGFQWEVVADEA